MLFVSTLNFGEKGDFGAIYLVQIIYERARSVINVWTVVINAIKIIIERKCDELYGKSIKKFNYSYIVDCLYFFSRFSMQLLWSMLYII